MSISNFPQWSALIAAVRASNGTTLMGSVKLKMGLKHYEGQVREIWTSGVLELGRRGLFEKSWIAGVRGGCQKWVTALFFRH